MTVLDEGLIARWVLPISMKSRNELDKLHWAARAKWRKELGLFALAKCGRPKAPATKLRALTITIVRRRRFDRDNAYGAAKPLIDALKSLGWIRNDSERWLAVEVLQELGEPETRVELRGWEP